jgi:oligosaccharide repeat unit polymerase
MTCTLATIFLALLTVLNYCAGKRSVLYPPFIFSFVWFADSAIFWYAPIRVSDVHAVTWWVITIGASLFSLGGLLSGILPDASFSAIISELSYPAVSRIGLRLLLLTCLAGMPLMIMDVLQHGGGGSLGELLVRSRQSYVDMAEQGESWGLVVGSLPIFSIAVTILCRIEDSGILFWIAAMASAVCCILTGGRSYVLLLFLSLTVTHLLIRRKDSLVAAAKYACIPVLIFASIFIALIYLDKDVSNYKGSIAALLTNFVLAYIIVPIPALDYVLMHSSEYANAPHHTFEFVLAVMSRFGASVNTPKMHDAYLFVPLPTNVYTVYKFFFTDFGLVLTLAAVLLIGFVQTAIYLRARAGNKVAIFLTALLVYPAVLSIFDDLYSGGGLVLVTKATLVATIYFAFLNRIYPGIRLPHLTFLGFTARTEPGRDR